MLRTRPHRCALALPLAVAAACVLFGPPSGAATKAGAAAASRYTERADVKLFIDELTRDYGFDRQSVTRWLGAARFQPKIIAAMERPVVAPPKWYEYAPPFLGADRIAQGAAFAKLHHDMLARAEDEYGVPAEIIVAILGVETYYGVRLSAPRRFLPRRAEGVPAARARAAFLSARPARVVRGRARHPAIHAGKRATLCRRFRRRRPHRPVEERR